MDNSVTHATALALKAAGFEQPEPMAGQMWYFGSQLCIICLIDRGSVALQGVGVSNMYSPGIQQLSIMGLFAPTATHILAAIPSATLEKEIGGQWVCRWPITEFQSDARYDDCPHEATAKAYLAWKNGMG